MHSLWQGDHHKTVSQHLPGTTVEEDARPAVSITPCHDGAQHVQQWQVRNRLHTTQSAYSALVISDASLKCLTTMTRPVQLQQHIGNGNVTCQVNQGWLLVVVWSLMGYCKMQCWLLGHLRMHAAQAVLTAWLRPIRSQTACHAREKVMPWCAACCTPRVFVCAMMRLFLERHICCQSACARHVS